MTQYIDKDALVAEIKNLENTYKKCSTRTPYEEGLKDGRLIGYKDVLHIINTLEVKEVDLEKEYKMFIDHDNGRSMFETGKHFFELGLKAKQTSEEIKIGETQIYLDDDGGEPPYDGKQWLDLSCTEYEIPLDEFIDGDNVEIIIRKTQKGE